MAEVKSVVSKASEREEFVSAVREELAEDWKKARQMAHKVFSLAFDNEAFEDAALACFSDVLAVSEDEDEEAEACVALERARDLVRELWEIEDAGELVDAAFDIYERTYLDEGGEAVEKQLRHFAEHGWRVAFELSDKLQEALKEFDKKK